MFRKLFGGVALAALCGVCPEASAQPQKEAAQVDEIIVTAQKRAERLQDVPISITHISAERMKDTGIVAFQDLPRATPGMGVTRLGPFITPSVRGITTTTQGILAENNVAVYVDGFYLPTQIGLNMGLGDVSSVEVLKGPQGTLFGRNATGGAVLVTTLDPSLTEMRIIADASYARFNDRQFDAYVAVPVNDRIGLSFAGSLRNSDGYVRDIGGFDSAPVDNRTFKAKLRFDPIDGTSIVATYKWDRISDPTGNAWIVPVSNRAALQNPALYVETRPYHTALTFAPATVAGDHQYSLKVSSEIAGLTVNSYSSYLSERDNIGVYDTDGVQANAASQILLQKQHSFSQEVNANYRTARVDAVVGAFYLSTYSSFPVLNVFAGNNVVFRQHNAGKGETWALFADGTLKATDRLAIIVGARYSEEKKTNLGTFVNNVPSTARATYHWNSFTPRLVARYSLDDSSNVYASVSRGFKAGVFNTNSVVPVNPEKLTAYEVGYKIAASRFRFDAATYYYDYKDLQAAAIVEGPGGSRQSLITNAATARIYGVEFQGQYQLTEALSIYGGVNYNHARYRDFPNAPAVLKQANGLNLLGQMQDWSGKRIVHAPDWTATLGADYIVQVASGELKISPNLYYTSAYTPFDNSLNPDGSYRYLQKGYVMLNGQVSWTPDGQAFTVSIFGRNLTDRVVKVMDYGQGQGDIRTFAEPRVYGVRLSYRLN